MIPLYMIEPAARFVKPLPRPTRSMHFMALLVLLLGLNCGKRSEHSGKGLQAQAPPRRGGTLKVVGYSDLDHMFTVSAYTGSCIWFSQAYARELVRFSPTGDFESKTHLVPDIAEEIPTLENGGISPDHCRYTFHLRPGVLWNSSPPRPVTAQDFVRAFKLLANPVSPAGENDFEPMIRGLAAYDAAFAQVPPTVEGIRKFVETHEIPGVHAMDDRTLVFELQAPAPDFLYLLPEACTAAVPREYLDFLLDGPEFRQHTLSDGPYAIAAYIPGRSISLDRNPAWDPRTDPSRPGYLDHIRIQLGIDDSLVQLQIDAGTADLSYISDLSPAEFAPLLAAGDPRLQLVPDGDHFGAFQYLVVNHVGPNQGGALRQLGVRQALALAVDKKALSRLLGGIKVFRPLYQCVPESCCGHRKEGDRLVTPGGRGDPQEARRLLALAGFPNGISLKLVHSTNYSSATVAQSLQASMARAGIRLQLMPYVIPDLYGRLLPDKTHALHGEWDLALVEDSADSYTRLNGRSMASRFLGGTPMNFGGFADEHLDKASARAMVALDEAKAVRQWEEAFRRATDGFAVIPLVEGRYAIMHSARLKGCTWNNLTPRGDPTVMWLDDASR